MIRILFLLIIPFGSIDDCIDATCRVATDCTGVCFDQDKNNIYVLTNAHVVDDQSTIGCEFWVNGKLNPSIDGEVILRSLENDVAIIQISKLLFTELPKIIPLAPIDYIPQKDEVILSIGCSGGSWPTLFKGHIVDYNAERGWHSLKFKPKPAGGRSGSAIFDSEGKQIIGLLRARDKIESVGFAIPLFLIYSTFEPKLKETNYYYTADWCKVCKKQTPIIERLVKEGYNFKIIKEPPEIKAFPTITIKSTILEGFQPYSKLKRILNGQEEMD